MNLLLDRLAKLYPKSLIAEFRRLFGTESTKKLLMIFGGTTIRIPSMKEILKMQRDLQIYEELARTVTRKDFLIVRRILEARYGLNRKKVREIHREMAKLHKEGDRIRKSDVAVGQHKRGRRRK